MKQELYLVLHDVRSAHNVGSLFRTADGAGVRKIFLTGYTPAPVDRFGRKDVKISKVSLGAENTVPWEKSDINRLLIELKEREAEIVALEQAPRSIPLREYAPNGERVALIVGNEVEGIHRDILALCDKIVEIPMKGEKESLNVSNAGSIALYTLAEKLNIQ